MCMWDSDTDPRGAGAATEPPLLPALGRVNPKVMTISIVTPDSEVLDRFVVAQGR